jgi:sulfur-oxidizing protein SoxA
MHAVAAILLACCVMTAAAQQRVLPPPTVRSGITFAGADIRAMQADDASNPGMLWVTRGEDLWNAATGAPSCASCHGDAQRSMRGVAARYPGYDAAAGAVLDLEARIDDCRVRRQQLRPWARESDELLALTSYVAFQSRGMPTRVKVADAAQPAFARGQAFYNARHGQMDMACADCHDRNWGKRLLVETISQGHGNAFPAYRLEWQGVGSLQRRIRACLFGIRAEMPSPGARELTDLELYLAWRADGLPLESPGVRR